MRKILFLFSPFRKNFKMFLYLSVILILVLSFSKDLSAAVPTGISEPQQVVIKGTITDATTGEVLPGVNVQVEGTTSGALTDINGYYSIDKTSDNIVLVFSFIGYTSQKVTTSGMTTIDVKLVPELQKLDEVVVTGYSSQRKKDITGSVAVLELAT